MESRRLLSPVETTPLFKMMLQNSKSTSILILDPEGNILDVNDGIQKSFGYSRESLVGKNFSVLFIQEDKFRQLPEKELKKAIEIGSANDEGFILKKDGSLTWVHGESIFTKDENGQGFIIRIIHDIHTTKLLEEELRKKNG
jgi:PAS domain S-box-containing protein